MKNHIFDRDDRHALMELVDPSWKGVLPYTLFWWSASAGLCAAGRERTIDPLEVKRAIVDHPMIGRYYRARGFRLRRALRASAKMAGRRGSEPRVGEPVDGDGSTALGTKNPEGA